MQVLLRISNGKANVRNVRLKADTVIGRSPDCQLKVASNQISRRHCQIVIRDNLVAIKDLGSANGTFVNGRQIPPEVEIPLTPGTRVMLGPLQFTVEYDLPGMAVVASAVTPTPVPVAALPTAPPIAPAPTVESEPNYDTVNAPLPFIPPQIPVPIASPPPVVPPRPAVVVTPVSAPETESVPEEEVGIPDFSEGIPDSRPEDATSPATVIARSPFADHQPAEAFSLPLEGAGDDEIEPGNFNFGIFASSSSGIIVESVSVSPDSTDSGASGPTEQEASKPAKKGLLSMFGWGKKKPATPVPAAEPAPAEAPEDTISMNPFPPAADDAGETLSFELPTENEAAAGGDEGSDEALNFFNNFK